MPVAPLASLAKSDCGLCREKQTRDNTTPPLCNKTDGTRDKHPAILSAVVAPHFTTYSPVSGPSQHGHDLGLLRRTYLVLSGSADVSRESEVRPQDEADEEGKEDALTG